MTVHLKKLSVGSASLENLQDRQKQVLSAGQALIHSTRNWPRRADELLDGGSLYWIIKGQMVARQPIKELMGSPDVVLSSTLRFFLFGPEKCAYFRGGVI